MTILLRRRRNPPGHFDPLARAIINRQKSYAVALWQGEIEGRRLFANQSFAARGVSAMDLAPDRLATGGGYAKVARPPIFTARVF